MLDDPHTKSVAIVDDHLLFAGSLEKLINSFPGFIVTFHAKNGMDLKEKLILNEDPHIILLDIKMPEMNGFETAEWLTKYRPNIKILALTMEDDEYSIIKMLRRGAKGYLLKDIHPEILNEALFEIMENGIYHTQQVSETLVNNILPSEEEGPVFRDQELHFIQLVCSEMTFKEIADKMKLSPKTVENYRHDVYNKAKVKTRVGMVLFALKNKLFQI
ncbi:response regulator [Aequorivita echinoideorum]|uniref:Response regulator transcription factor n=1 Tax=Aequorivita echinoideorum TaxID=1549647 RepID=A0ABS5S6V7_9FLAO|nr:response regulator transcription factor [Aequorivita echinoideorum]MBT0608945.1 response regulator transcription factor [Aequorivita echinoideorum]